MHSIPERAPSKNLDPSTSNRRRAKNLLMCILAQLEVEVERGRIGGLGELEERVERIQR